MELKSLLRLHEKLQQTFPPVGRVPQDLEGEEAIQFAKDMKLALEAELQEMLDECGWKPWATSRHLNAHRMRQELIDAIHFWLNLWMLTFPPDTSPSEMGATWESMYLAKNGENFRRMREGYDGITGKCPNCKRDWTDQPPLSHAVYGDLGTALVFYCPCGHTLTKEEVEWLRSRALAE